MPVKKIRKGVYAIRWWNSDRTRYHQETVKGSREDALSKLRKKLDERLSPKEIEDFGPHPFAKLAEKYLQVRGPQLTPAWIRTVQSYLEKNILPAIGRTRVRDLRPIHLETYKNARKAADAADATVNREMNVVLGILSWAERMGLIFQTPIPRARVQLFQEKPKKSFFSLEEWNRLVSSIEDPEKWEAHMAKVRWIGPIVYVPGAGIERRFGGGIKPDGEASEAYRQRLRAALDVFRAIILLGLRRSEMLSLTWQEVDLEAGIVSVTVAKTHDVKVIPISAQLREILDRQPRGIGAALVFQRPGGGAWMPKTLLGHMKTLLRIAGLPESFTIHDLRRTAGSWLTHQDTQERKVRDYLGHKDVQTTQVYTHNLPEHLQAPADTLGKMLDQAEAVTRKRNVSAESKKTRSKAGSRK